MPDNVKKIFSARNFFIAVLSIACLLALWWTASDLRYVYLSGQRMQIRNSLSRRPATTADIQPWMTFDYINVIFKLPPAYLKNSLNINDPHYPNLSVSRWARSAGQNAQTALQHTKDAVSRYQNK